MAQSNQKDAPGNPGRGKMTVGEAGRLGGEARKQELGPEGYAEMGRKGGEARREAQSAHSSAEGRGGAQGSARSAGAEEGGAAARGASGAAEPGKRGGADKDRGERR